MQYLNADCIESFWDAQPAYHPISRPAFGIPAYFAGFQDNTDHTREELGNDTGFIQIIFQSLSIICPRPVVIKWKG